MRVSCAKRVRPDRCAHVLHIPPENPNLRAVAGDGVEFGLQVFLGKRQESLETIDRLIKMHPENKEFRKLRVKFVGMKKEAWEVPEDSAVDGRQ